MRKILWGLGLILLIGYGAWPYLTLYQLDTAVVDQDVKALDNLVDWESVAQGLEQDLEALFEDAYDASSGADGSENPLDSLAENLLGIFADLMIDPIVNFYMTPSGLAYLLNTQIILEDPSEVFEQDFPSEDTWADHISFAFFSGPTTFFANAEFPEGRASEKDARTHDTMTLEFRFQNFRWQLTRVHLPLDDIG